MQIGNLTPRRMAILNGLGQSSGGGGGGGGEQSQTQTFEPKTAISPVLQTAVTPTISPIFSQVQDSPNADIRNLVSTYTPTAFSATGGGVGEESQGPGLSIDPMSDTSTPEWLKAPKSAEELMKEFETGGRDWLPWIITGTVIAGGLIWYAAQQKKKRKK